MRHKEFWLGISDTTTGHISVSYKDSRASDYHVIDYAEYEKALEALEVCRKALINIHEYHDTQGVEGALTAIIRACARVNQEGEK